MGGTGGGRNKIIDFWVRKFEEEHHFTPLMERRDCVMLHNLRKHFDDRALTYAIKHYMKESDDFVAKAGWSVPVFKHRVQGYVAAYHKRKIRETAASPRMGRIVGSITNGRGGSSTSS